MRLYQNPFTDLNMFRAKLISPKLVHQPYIRERLHITLKGLAKDNYCHSCTNRIREDGPTEELGR
jgi:hypothetical protein